MINISEAPGAYISLSPRTRTFVFVPIMVVHSWDCKPRKQTFGDFLWTSLASAHPGSPMTGKADPPHEPDRGAAAHLEVPGGCPRRVACRNKGHITLAKINREGLAHDPSLKRVIIETTAISLSQVLRPTLNYLVIRAVHQTSHLRKGFKNEAYYRILK